jgi:hypothetical protein
MKELFQKHLKLWILPVIALLVVNYIYFFPVLTGKVITQDDIIMGIAKGKEIVDYRAANNDEPLWTNAMFSGMPAFQISTEYPNNWLTQVQNVIVVLGGKTSSIYIIAALMIGFYFLLLSFKVNPWLAVVGSIAFGFSAFFIISFAAGHNSKVRTAAYMAPLIMGVLLVYRNKLLAGFALTALFLGLSIKSGHFQITFYTGIIVLCIMVAYKIEAWRTKTFGTYLKQSAVLGVAAILAIGPNIGNLWSTYAYTQETMRGGSSELAANEESKGGLDFDYAMMWSYGVGESFNLMTPNLMGGGAKQTYEGTQTHDFLKRTFQGQGMSAKKAEETANQYSGSMMYWGNQSMVNGGYYVGAIVFFLFIFGLLVIKGVTRNWAIASVVFALFLAWGENFAAFNRVMFDYVPLFNKFRVPSMALVVLFFVLPFIGFLGLDKLLKGEEGPAYFKKQLLMAFYIAGGLALALAVVGPFIFGFEGLNDENLAKQGLDVDMLVEDRQGLLRSSAFASFVYIALAAAVLWFYNLKKLQLKYALLALGVLIVADLWFFDKDQLGKNEFVSQREFMKQFAPTDADNMILKDTDIHYRVFNSTAGLTSDSYTSYHHKSIGGYHGAKLMRYQDLIENQLQKGNMEVLNMLNAKWILTSSEQGAPKQAMPNMQACGQAWTVDKIIWAADANAEMAALTDFKANYDVVIDERYRDYVGAIQTMKEGDNIELTSYDPKNMVYKATISGQEDLVVFSEIFYQAPKQEWQAYLDGEPVEHIRVNYLLRALKVPVGEHEIVFKFEPETYFKGEVIDLTFSILLFIALLGAAAFEWRNSRTTTAKAEK